MQLNFTNIFQICIRPLEMGNMRQAFLVDKWINKHNNNSKCTIEIEQRKKIH